MRKVLALAAVASIGIVAAPAAHADGPPVVTTDGCNSITVTAPADARVIWSIDNEPPSGLDPGQTATRAFPPSAATHSYVAFINPGPTVTWVDGTVTDCPFTEPTAEQLQPAPIPGPAPAPAVEPVVSALAVAEPVVPALDLTAWEEVAIAPPW